MDDMLQPWWKEFSDQFLTILLAVFSLIGWMLATAWRDRRRIGKWIDDHGTRLEQIEDRLRLYREKWGDGYELDNEIRVIKLKLQALSRRIDRLEK